MLPLHDIVTSRVSQATVTPPPAPPSPDLERLRGVIDTFIADANKKLTTGPTGPMGLIEVTSLLQLPIILEKLQNSPESIRLNFPPDTTGQVTPEQKQIHELLSDRHSKSLGELTTAALNLLSESEILKGLTTDVMDFARNYLLAKVNPDPNHASTLQVNHIIDASQPGADLKKLADQLVQGVKQGSNKGGFILQVPAQGIPELLRTKHALVQHIGPLLNNNEAQANLAYGTIWLGASQVWEGANPLINQNENFTVMSFEDLWKQFTAQQRLQAQRQAALGAAPPPAVPTTPGATASANLASNAPAPGAAALPAANQTPPPSSGGAQQPGTATATPANPGSGPALPPPLPPAAPAQVGAPGQLDPLMLESAKAPPGKIINKINTIIDSLYERRRKSPPPLPSNPTNV